MDAPKEDVGKKINLATEELIENVDKTHSKLGSPSPRITNLSRYGRLIKSKSPSTVMLDSFKSSKMPKNVKQDTSIEDTSIKMDDTLSVMDDTINSSLDNKVEEENLNIEDLQSQCPWTLGQIVWSRIGNFPFWPSVVTLHPDTMTYVSQRGSGLLKKTRTLHVTFCADKGQHSWVSFGNVIPFLGIADFEKRSKQITSETKKREPKYAAAFSIKPSIKLKWDDAVAEASGLMTKSVAARIEMFKPKKNKNNSSLNKSVNSIEKTEENSKKRKKTAAETDEDVSITKKSKQEIEEVESLEERLDSKIGNNLSLETPPTPPSSHKDSSDEASISNKYTNKKKSGKHGVFEVFCERNKESAEQLDPDATEEDIKAYLLDLWVNMSSQERSKYRADYLQSEGLYSLNVSEDYEDDEEDDEEEDDDDEDEDDDDEDDDDYDDEDYYEPKCKKPMRKQRTKGQSKIDEFFIQDEPSGKTKRRRRSKFDPNITKEELSDQEELEILDKSTTKKRKSKARQESSDQEDVISVESGEKPVKKQKSKNEKEDSVGKEEQSTLIVETGKRNRPYNLFKGMKSERVCQICEKTGKLIRCRGPCHSYFHLACVKPGESSPEPSEAGDIRENNAYIEDLKEIKEKAREIREKEEEAAFDYDNFKCIDCLSGIAPPCFVCHERGDKRVKCSTLACGKHYHPSCLKSWPQCQWQGGRLTCPYHICHTCVSDNPQNGHPRSAGEKFAKCIKCPSTYHASISCLPAGSNILTGSQIVCPKHYKSTHPPVNATWCFLCTRGGSLICCDTCPTSFHLECLGIDAPDGGYICEDCETGRLPLYGEVVWVKLGTYRWWPSVICYPEDIPSNIAVRPHKTGEFCVMFLGTRDYYWIHRGKAFLFQEGDVSAKVIGSKKTEEFYRKALQEATFFHERLQYEKEVAKGRDIAKGLKPPHYVKLKVNKPVGNVKIPEVDSTVACDCNPNEPYPCSPDSDCLNRMLLIECSLETCPAGTKCQNQLFVQRKYPAMKPVHTEERGWGLKALEPIKQSQFVIEYVGEIIDEAEYRLRLQQKRERKNENYYFLTIDNSRMIDAEPKGNLSRFMNHSCQPNCETQKWTVNGDTRIGLFALRNIEPGEELTFNYNLACDGETRKPCLCKAPNCSGFIGLKVSKQQISLVQQKKIEKAEKVKKQRKNKKNLCCWNCNLKINNPDETHRCDQKTCGKVYHSHCIAIEDGPEKIFHCPWHFCAECYKRTAIRCNYCCNAFCQLHVYGNLREHTETASLICYKHDTEDGTYNDIDLGASGEALMDDDGDDDVVITDEYNIVDTSREQVSEVPIQGIEENVERPTSSLASPLPSTTVTTAISSLQPDEISPRGAIVEVHASSEDGDEENDSSQKEDEDEPDSDECSKKRDRRRQRRKESTAESDFTLDQIAAIIGIVK